MFIIQAEQLADFTLELQQLLPHSFNILNLARNCLEKNRFAWPGIEFVTDRFPQFRACIVRPSPTSTEHVPRPHHPTYTLCAKDTNALRSLLQEEHVVDWSQPAFFAPVWEPLSETVQSVMREHGTLVGPETRKDFQGSCIGFCESKLTESPSIPDGFVVKSLSRSDIELVNSNWYFGKTCQTKDYLLYLYDHGFPTIGIFTQNNQLVGYEICNAEMIMIAAYVHPDYRNRKFFRILTHYFCKAVFSLGLEKTYAVVNEANVASHTSLNRAGGEQVGNCNINWIVYKPCNYTDQNNTLLVWLENLKGTIWQQL